MLGCSVLATVLEVSSSKSMVGSTVVIVLGSVDVWNVIVKDISSLQWMREAPGYGC